MERSTLLAAIWNQTDADSDPEQIAEATRERLESGDLQAAGNFRHKPASYWEKDEENG